MVVNAKIVFDSTREGIEGIYVMDDDGGNVTLLTDMLHPVCCILLYQDGRRMASILCFRDKWISGIKEIAAFS